MQTREHSATEEMRRPADEKYRVIPASILDSPGRPKPMTAHRFSRYLFGMVVLVALGAMGYFAFTEHLLAGEAGEDSQWERLIAELKGGSGSDGSTLEEGQVQLQIVSRPDGALIEIDDTPIGTTPLMHRLETGAYIISVKKPNYATIDTVVVFVEGGVSELAFSLSESSGILGGSDAGTLAQGAIPPGIDATSSSAAAGSTRDVSQNAGSRPTAAAASGGGSASSGSTPGSGMPAPNRSTPPVSDASNVPSTESAGGDVGAITISSEPAGASVVIGGRFLGRTPLTSVPVPLGTHDLTFFL